MHLFSLTKLCRPGLLLALLLTSCSPLPKMLQQAEAGRRVTVEPAPLTAVGESVPFEATARVAGRHLRKGAVYEVLLTYRYDHNLRLDTLGRLSFAQGEFTYDDSVKGRLVSRRRFTIANTPGRSPGQLLARGQVRELKPRGKVLAAKTETLVARGIADPARRVVLEDTLLALLPEHATNTMSGTRILPLYFDQGQWFIRSHLGTNIAALEDLIDQNQHTQRVLIAAGHSPDSLDAHKPQLASKRVKMLLYYYKQRVKGFSYLNKVEDITFDTLAYRNSWELLLNQVQNSVLKPAQQDSIVSIINDTHGTFAQKEKALHKLSYFDYLEDYIYPVLRWGTVAVTYTAPPRYDSEVYILSKKILEKEADIDALTPEELRYSATLTPLLAEKQRIYELAAASTARWEAFYNLGTVLALRAEKEISLRVQQNYYHRAAVNFTLAAHRHPTAELFYRAASAHHHAQERLEALQDYDYAIKLGGARNILRKVFSDKAALEIQVGQPDQALTSLRLAGPSYQNYMNQGLLLVQRGAYDAAAAQYQLALDLRPQAAAPHYGLAVAAARRHDEPAMADELRKAIHLNRDLATQAVEDLEFQDYAQGKAFREALK
ncbi:tetratricopeptide repeat protein [Hymenobacter sp. BRD67]|uniref:tetratricopeptide repeat protein n=1 Tax=Hymenobacter sp. BRD67 TaxID=2675877 RepID=UPI0015648175|nr:tetratricopeptide repeat protein [Hymenobacter sp. BRD67]QKG51759.1 tetratricopeptide repeat protein [Hymenobacter sp. BRD67]